MTEGDDLIREQVESTAESIEALDVEELQAIHPDSIPEVEPLDVRATVNMRGDIVGSIVLVLGTGGPHIEFDVTERRIEGYWGGSEAFEPISNRDVCEHLDAYYRERFEETVLA